MLQEIVGYAERNGIQTLIGIYIPTEKNKIVSEHYSKLGFSEAERKI